MMIRKFCHSILVVSLLLPLGCVLEKGPAKRPEQLTFAPLELKLPEVERFQTSNGIRVFFIEDRELPLISITALVGGGTLEDPDDKVGLGDLFGPVLRSGGAGEHSPDEVDEILEAMAANISVDTETYATALDLSVRTSDLEKGLTVLNDLLRSPRFAQNRLDLAREKAIEGIRRRNDFPAGMASRSLQRQVYQGHPLGRESTEQSVSKVTRGDLVEFHHRHFHPNNLWLAVSGDLDAERLKNLLNTFFGDWPEVELQPFSIPPLPERPEPLLLLSRKDVPQTTILMGGLGIDKSVPDLPEIKVMNYILGGGGFNSRLMREIRSNRGLAYSVYSHFQTGRCLPGLFMTGCETKSESTMEVIGLIRGIMQQMRVSPISGEELCLAKESLINSFVFAFTDSHAVTSRALRLEYYDFPEGYLENYRSRIAAVTVEGVLEAAQNHLHPEKLNIVLVGDPDRFDASPATLGLKVEEKSLRSNN